MTRYRRLRLFVVAALAVQLVVGLVGEVPPRREYFPFASWFLFSLVPGSTTDYDLVLRAQGDQPFASPLRYSQAGRLVLSPHSIVAYHLIQRFGAAVETRDPQTAALRRQIDIQFTLPAIHYDLVKSTYAPVERWKSREPPRSVPIGSYVSGRP